MIEKNLLLEITKTKTFSQQNIFLITKLSLLFISLFAILSTGCQTPPDNGPVVGPYYSQTEYDLPPEQNAWEILHSLEQTSVGNIPSDWYPIKYLEKDWDAIVIHHSATETGNMAKFHKSHINEHGWDGIGYDFVIGNGTDSGDGEIEVTYRWTEQKVGAHCKTPGNWANEHAIGICLVGNFNNRTPSPNQMNSLVKLTKFLQQRYGISQTYITGHKDTDGANITDCPGRSFPMTTFKSALNY